MKSLLRMAMCKQSGGTEDGKGSCSSWPLDLHFFYQELAKNVDHVPPEVLELARQNLATHAKDGSRRSWVCRWRQRWGFGVRALPSRKLEFSEIISRKAKNLNIVRARFCLRRLRPFWKI